SKRKRSVSLFSKEKTLVIKSLTFFNIYYIIFRLHLYLNKLVTSKYFNHLYQRNRLSYLMYYSHHYCIINYIFTMQFILLFVSTIILYITFFIILFII